MLAQNAGVEGTAAVAAAVAMQVLAIGTGAAVVAFGPAAARACTLCLKCGEACPTGAIVPLVEKDEARMGEAVVDERLCVSHNGTGVCGACHVEGRDEEVEQ